MSSSQRWKLPDTATAPFCPSEVQGTIQLSSQAPFWKKVLLFFGPGLLVSVGYMDPGNWATDIEAGAKYGYSLLFVVLISSVLAILLQCISLRIGLATQHDLAQLSRKYFPKFANFFLWGQAEVAIIATDVAEVLGAGLAFSLLLGCSLRNGILLTALDTLIVLGLKGKGFRKVEAIILGLIITIGLCFFVELFLLPPDWGQVATGFVPNFEVLQGWEPWYLAVGILGATVMPHNLYLHSNIVHTREVDRTPAGVREAIRMNTLDTAFSLSLAFVVNAAILILAARAFHQSGHTQVTGIDEAYHLLEPIVGTKFGSILFGLALLAAGQSSTFTGTIAGQIVMEGFWQWKIPCWQRRLLTRALALVPAYLGVVWLGDHSAGRLLVLSQVILSLLLPLSVLPMLLFASSAKVMGEFRIPRIMQLAGWFAFAIIVVANGLLLFS